MHRARLDFVCVGPQRTATSWLDRVLRKHPAIALPEVVKETFFLDRRADKGWDWYWNSYFPGGTHLAGRVVGEIAPTLFDSADAIKQLAAHNAECRIVVCLRDPVARALSLFEHYVSIARVPNDWDRARERMPSITEASCYAKYISAWGAAFGADRVLLLSHRAVAQDPMAVLDRLCDFLEVERLAKLPVEAEERYGVAAAPRSRAVVWAADRAAWTLRSLRLHSLVNLGKQLGLKRLVFSGGQRPVLGVTVDQKAALTFDLGRESALVAEVDAHIACLASECRAYWEAS